jgi:cell wall-associated NlpC family hydrolase
MTGSGAALAAAALALVGTPFRLNGRDSAHGLDCLGLLEAALAACGHSVRLPVGYQLHLTRLDDWLPPPASLGLIPVTDPIQPGDVLLLRPGPAQAHLVIAGPDRDFIHAHAGLRRTVRSPDRPAGALLGHWRLAAASSAPTE